jgi:hypothetical protein
MKFKKELYAVNNSRKKVCRHGNVESLYLQDQTINIHLQINEGQEGNKSLPGGRHQWEVGGHKERENEGEYGICILYPHTKIEKLNLLKLY